MLDIRYVCELVQRSLTDLLAVPNVGNTSLKEIQAQLATLGLTSGMTLDDDSYRAAVVAAVAATLVAAKGGAAKCPSETGGA